MSIRPLDSAVPSPARAVEGIAVRDESRGNQNASQPAAALAAMPSREAVATALIAVNEALGTRGRTIKFAMDPDTRTIVVTLIDTETNQVLRQIPAQELLDIAKSIDQQRHLLRNQA